MRKSALALAGFIVFAASPSFADRQPCLRIGYIYNWKATSDRTLIVEDEWHKKFRLKLIGVCNNLAYHERLAFKSLGALELSCLEIGDEVITRDFGTGPERCAITKIEDYTPQMEQADKAIQAAKDQHGSN